MNALITRREVWSHRIRNLNIPFALFWIAATAGCFDIALRMAGFISDLIGKAGILK